MSPTHFIELYHPGAQGHQNRIIYQISPSDVSVPVWLLSQIADKVLS